MGSLQLQEPGHYLTLLHCHSDVVYGSISLAVSLVPPALSVDRMLSPSSSSLGGGLDCTDHR